MAKTTEQLLEQAVQIRDEQANKKNTALRVGTLFSDIIQKQEESDQTHASDVTKINESINENKEKLTELGEYFSAMGINRDNLTPLVTNKQVGMFVNDTGILVSNSSTYYTDNISISSGTFVLVSGYLYKSIASISEKIEGNVYKPLAIGAKFEQPGYGVLAILLLSDTTLVFSGYNNNPLNIYTVQLGEKGFRELIVNINSLSTRCDNNDKKIEGVEDRMLRSGDTPEDFSIKDENGNAILSIIGGHLYTKNYDSRKIPYEDKLDALEDFSIQDKNGNVILSIINGFIRTKNFDSKKFKGITPDNMEWGIEWGHLPQLGINPLSKVRFDGGMCRIFRDWGYIGDSLNSGEFWGFISNVIDYRVTTGKSVVGGNVVTDNTSSVSDAINASGYQPKMKLIFKEKSGLEGKILVALNNGGTYTEVLTGGSDTEYIVTLNANNEYILSFPSDNKPKLLIQNTYVNDDYHLSWGQQMARLCGATGYNFSVGGEYAKRWCVGEDNQRRWQQAQKDLKDVYTIALGTNDKGYWLAGNTEVVNYPCVTSYPSQSQYGSLTINKEDVLADIDVSDYNNNADSFAGWYTGIIQRIKSIQKDAIIFCVIYSFQDNQEWDQTIRHIVNIMNEYYEDNTIWLVDCRTYCPINTDNVNLNGHLSAYGYLYIAYQISSYIDWIVRHNIDAFRGTSLIGKASRFQFDA